MNMPKILNLILYNNTPNYAKMKNITSKYLKTANIPYFYYCFSPHINNRFVIDGDMIEIKGVETFVPGILLKTLEALKISLLFDYDYILRTNISTIVNISEISKFLKNEPVNYGGGTVFDLQWDDANAGITNGKYKGTLFAQGTAIVLSRDCVKLLIDNQHHIDRTVVDDVSLGVFFDKFKIPAINMSDKLKFVSNSDVFSPKTVFYRNKRISREDDLIHMEHIVNELIANK